MTELSQKILAEYQVRKTKKQKQAFIKLMQAHFPELQIQEGGFPKCKNLIIGDVESAALILTAHYDTCARLPFPNFITPKAPLLSILYSFLLALPVALIVFGVNFVLSFFPIIFELRYFISLAVSFGLLSLMFLGPANKHTANDNTSGVIVLCELLKLLSKKERSKVAFVFFDHEESGLLGSGHFRSKYKNVSANTPMINFDCVSDGDYILVAASKAARQEIGDQLDAAFQPKQEKTILQCKAEKIYYPSDQMGFRKGIAIAALKKKPLIGYYMDRIHTARDTEFDRRNIRLLCDSILRLLKSM